MDYLKGDQKRVAAASLSRLNYLGQASTESSYALAEVPKSLLKVVFDNLTYLELKPHFNNTLHDYSLEDGTLSLTADGLQKLAQAGVRAPVIDAIQGRAQGVASRSF